MRPARAAAAIAALAFAGACTGKPPEIGLIDLKPIYVRHPGTGAIETRLRLYLQASDPDGVEDLAAFYLIHDAREIFWEVRGGAWQSGGDGWIGTHALALPPGWQVPAGTYRVVLEDAAGETVERQVRVDPVAPAGLRFPRAVETSGAVTVEPANAWVWAYSEAGGLVAAGPPAQVPWDRVRSYFVYTADARLRVGLLSGPYSR